MASTSASLSELENHLHCSSCMSYFTDPVTTACGHSFCKQCLERSCYYNDSTCPLCKKYVVRFPDVNIVLRDIVEQLKEQKKTQQEDDKDEDDEDEVDEDEVDEDGEDLYTGAPGEVACDICTEIKLKAKKSCLVCLASYCSAHLENHSIERLKGHKLVQPVENLDARACLKHGRPLELYSRKQQACICVRCIEGQDEVVSTEDEWNKKKTELKNTKSELNQNIDERKTKISEIEEALKSCKDQLESEWWDIEKVFNAVTAIVQKVQARLLQPLKERTKVLDKEAKGLKDKLEAEIKKFENTISELDDISVLEDHILFLQMYPSLNNMGDIRDWDEVKLDTSLSFGTMRKTTRNMMEKIEQEIEKLTSLELKRIPKFAVDVKLDPDSAHRRLVLSNDGKEVKDGGKIQEVPYTLERFDLFGSVVGLNSLTCGKSYWEVEVGKKTGWDIGVAKGDENRKGKIKVNPDNGYWVIVHYEGEKYAALTSPPLRLTPKEKPEKVGVFVDYEEGLVSFYNVTAESHIYSFTECSFRDELYPYFSPHAKQEEKNCEPLIICGRKNCDDDALECVEGEMDS